MRPTPADSIPAADAANGDLETLLIRLREIVGSYLTIDDVRIPRKRDFRREDLSILAHGNSQAVVTFSGRLRGDSETTYDQLDAALAPLDLFALFRRGADQSPHHIHIIAGRAADPPPMARWLPIVLFIATVLSVLFTGLTIAAGEISLSDPAEAERLMSAPLLNLWLGLPYAFAILAILVPHEMGHWLMMRRYRVPASLPYFLPAFGISPFGTFGAAILLRGSLKNRKVLFDLGAAGPLAGLVVCIPILLIGLNTSIIVPYQPGGLLEGNSLMYAAAKMLVFGQFLPNGEIDVLLNQFAWAGWTGLFVTALNLIPLGQLDGGHVLYSLLGDTARRLYWPLLMVMLVLAIFVSSAWIVFGVLLLLVGRFHAVPLDDLTQLDGRRRALAVFTLLIFVLIFTPNPIYYAGQPSGLLSAVGMTGFLLGLRGVRVG